MQSKKKSSKKVIFWTFALLFVLLASIATTVWLLLEEKYVDNETYWGYECINGKCERQVRNESTYDQLNTIHVCHLICEDYLTLWPRPTGKYVANKHFPVAVNVKGMKFNFPASSRQSAYWQIAKDRFFKFIKSGVPNGMQAKRADNFHSFEVNIFTKSDNLDINHKTDESYTLHVNDKDVNGLPSNVLVANIRAETFFGARHGLETLSQLVVYDAFRNKFVIPHDIIIEDAPVYPHRGFLLDTVRHYYTLDAIARTIDTMAMVKLNVFHWHITDSQTFPMVTKSHPDLSRVGSYAKHAVYQPKEIYEMVQYAKARGILVIPEFDAPAHVSEGWQDTGLVTCRNFQPWNKYCPGPPCGQLDPSQDRVYDVLEDIYRDMFDMFNGPPFFHMGGDEVNFNCWNSSEALQDRMLAQGMLLETDDFLDLWFHFQTKAHDRVDRIWSNETRIILWTSTLTESEKFVVDKEKYIIQVWTTGIDPTVKDLLNKGYDLIMSNNDALYFDCGFGLYVDEGNNWCSPYKAWTQVYNNNLRKLAGGEQYEKQILGAEACFWSSISDEVVLDSRLWPRLSALAERLWVEPEENFRSAESRMLLHREILVQNGIGAEPIQPEWCLQNKGDCTR